MSIFTADEIAQLSDQINRQLQQLQTLETGLKGEPEEALVLQQQTIEQVTKEAPRSFLQRFGRAAKSDLCEEDGMLHKQWQKWGDLDNKEAVERLGAVLLAMGFTGGVLRSLTVAVVVIVVHIGVKAFCDDYGDGDKTA